MLNRKLAAAVAVGEKSYDIPRWLAVSLPMFVVDSLYVVLMYVDVLILKQFRSPDEIAIYYAAVKTLTMVSFVYFAVAAASAHKFSEYFEAGDRKRLAEFVGRFDPLDLLAVACRNHRRAGLSDGRCSGCSATAS